MLRTLPSPSPMFRQTCLNRCPLKTFLRCPIYDLPPLGPDEVDLPDTDPESGRIPMSELNPTSDPIPDR